MMKEHIFLIGFMGAGKSTIAARLKEMTGAEVIEMDQEIERQQGMAISAIFAEKGEPFFRSLETQLLASMGQRPASIVSCGGGAAMRQENVDLMKENGCIVLLTAAPETIYQRVKDSQDRPVLNGNMNVEYIRDLMEKRRPYYEKAADLFVSTDEKTAEEICREILSRLDTL